MDETARKKMWADYAKTKRSDIREKIILEYAPLVKVVAGRLSMYLGYNVEYEDLVSYGIFGLIDAIDKLGLSLFSRHMDKWWLKVPGSSPLTLRFGCRGNFP